MAIQPVRPIPVHPSLEHDRKQAKALLKAIRAGDPKAQKRFEQHHPQATPSEPTLAAAQTVIAREYGFPSWPRWKTYVEMRVLHGQLDAKEAQALSEKLHEMERLAQAKAMEDELLAMERSARAAALVQAACGKDTRRASMLLAIDPTLAAHDLYTACVTGEAEALAKQLRDAPDLIHAAGGPMGWPAILYATHTWLLRSDPKRVPGIVKCAGLLVQAGADVNAQAKGEFGDLTPLYGAAGIAGHAELTRMLLQAGADPDEGCGEPDPEDHEASAWGTEALYHATEHEDPACLALLLAAQPHSFRVSYCLGRALDFEGREAHVRLFLEHHADPNFRVPWGGHRTHLLKAVQQSRSQTVVRLLIEAGGDVHAADASGITAVSAAMRLGREDLVALLLEHGALASQITETDRAIAACLKGTGDTQASIAEGAAALSVATRREDLPAMRALLQAGVPVDGLVPDESECTALHLACWRGRRAAVALLLEHGAAVDRVSGYQATPMGMAVHGSVHCADPEGGMTMRLAEEVTHGDYAGIVELLIQYGADLPAQTQGSDAVRGVLGRHGVRG